MNLKWKNRIEIHGKTLSVKILVATVIWHLYRTMASKVSKSTRRQTRRATLIILRGTILPFFCLIFILILRTIFHRTRQKEPFEYIARSFDEVSRAERILIFVIDLEKRIFLYRIRIWTKLFYKLINRTLMKNLDVWIQNWHFMFHLTCELLLHFSLSTNENCIEILWIVSLENFEFIHKSLYFYIFYIYKI